MAARTELGYRATLEFEFQTNTDLAVGERRSAVERQLEEIIKFTDIHSYAFDIVDAKIGELRAVVLDVPACPAGTIEVAPRFCVRPVSSM